MSANIEQDLSIGNENSHNAHALSAKFVGSYNENLEILHRKNI